jgi:16S rRNA (cytosine967-C5)-methyltransferase
LAASAPFQALDVRDRAFARLLATAAIRRLGQVDDLLRRFLDRPLPPNATTVHDILRLGTTQLCFLNTRPHAAVDSAVALAEMRGQARFKGAINAVLRRAAREGAAAVAAQDAARLNTPEWLWRSWTVAYGEPVARAIADSHRVEPPLDISTAADTTPWATVLAAKVLPTGTLRRPSGGRIPELPGFAEGAWWVQDAAAALPVRLLEPVAGRRIADLCAAPGGKTLQLAALGAEVTAVDISESKLRRLRENLKRTGLKAEAIKADAATWRPPRTFDAVLIDAPCTATGTIRRHPDLPWLKSAGDLPALTALQDRLLRHAVDLVAAGGVIVYSVCSLEPEEGPERIEGLFRDRLPVSLDPIHAEELGPGCEAFVVDGCLRTLPCHWPERGGLDGFFAARLRKV